MFTLLVYSLVRKDVLVVPVQTKLTIVSEVLERLNGGRRGVRIFGEMVALLWKQGNHPAAVRERASSWMRSF
jgi:hypothetical protein